MASELFCGASTRHRVSMLIDRDPHSRFKRRGMRRSRQGGGLRDEPRSQGMTHRPSALVPQNESVRLSFHPDAVISSARGPPEKKTNKKLSGRSGAASVGVRVRWKFTPAGPPLVRSQIDKESAHRFLLPNVPVPKQSGRPTRPVRLHFVQLQEAPLASASRPQARSQPATMAFPYLRPKEPLGL